MAQPQPGLSPEAEKELVDSLEAMAEAPPPKADADLSQEDRNVTFKRKVAARRGRLPILPRRVVEKEKSKD